MARRRKLLARAMLILGVALISSAIFAATDMQHQSERATPQPSPLSEQQVYLDDYPVVDWSYWQEVNPDILGWATIPGTCIDLPIVQGPADDPDYYLSHDIYKEDNPNGCPYLDAECAEMGLLSRNSVIFAHHTSAGTMFSQLANYSDSEFASEHPRILLQTPDWKIVLAPRMVDVVNASKEPKQVTFSSDEEFSSWWQEKRSGATLDVNTEETPARVYSFVTCSYTTWKNERTIVYAAR